MGKWLPLEVKHKGRLPQLIGWVLLNLGMILPGLLLVINPNFWSTTQTLTQVMHLPIVVVLIIGGFVSLCGVAAFRRTWRDICYFIGLIFYGLLTIAFIVALLTGIQIGVFFILLPGMSWVYAEASVAASKEIPLLPSQKAKNR